MLEVTYPWTVAHPPGSSVHVILQVRILEWVTISFPRASSRPRDWTQVSCIGRWILYCPRHQGSPNVPTGDSKKKKKKNHVALLTPIHSFLSALLSHWQLFNQFLFVNVNPSYFRYTKIQYYQNKNNFSTSIWASLPYFPVAIKVFFLFFNILDFDSFFYLPYFYKSPFFTNMTWRRKWQPTPVFLPGESHGQRSLAGCSPRGHRELDRTEWLT